MRIEFKVVTVPVAMPRPKFTTHAGHGRAYTPTSRKRPDGTRVSTGIAEFKTDVRRMATEQYTGAPLLGPIALDLCFVMPRPQFMIWKKKPMPRALHTVKPDLDNLEKAVKDALTKIIWKDDAQVCDVTKKKRIAAGDEQPHVIVVIEEITEEAPL